MTTDPEPGAAEPKPRPSAARARGYRGDAIAQFRVALQRRNIIAPSEIIADGNIHRCDAEGRNGRNDASYLLHLDGLAAGGFENHRDGLGWENWHAEGGRRGEARRDETSRRAEARQRAQAIWERSTPVEEHPYLTRKGVRSHGLGLYKGALVVPMRDGELCSLQFIEADGTKRFLTGGRKRGCYFPIGAPGNVVCLAEGFATAASVFEATGYQTLCCFDAGNLEPVARSLHTDAKVIVCSDDDVAGATAAHAAALACGGYIATPDFGPDRPPGVSDFNDMHALRGTQAVAAAIEAAWKPQESAEAVDQEPLWPDPTPLPEELPEVASFDPALLPDALRAWIEDIAERVQCPLDFPAVGAIISLGSVIGRKVAMQPKRRDDWEEFLNLWGCIVGRPGVLKTPALQAVMRLLHRLEAQAREAFDAEWEQWAREREAAKIRREASRSNALKAAKKGHPFEGELLDVLESDEPKARRFIVNDTSVEALGEILIANPNGTLAYRDELIGLLKSLDKEGYEGARAFYLSAWSEKEPYTFDRIGRGLNRRIDACCVSLLGSIQPAVIGEYLRQAIANAGDDGLLSRFSLLVWPDARGEWRNVDRLPDTAAQSGAFEVFERLDALGDAGLARFDDSAQEAFFEWFGAHQRNLRASEEHPALVSHLAKYAKLVPALALILHFADAPAGPVSEAATLRALAWAEYLESHARRAYASVTRAEYAAARALLAKVRARALADQFTLRDVYRANWAHLGSPEAARHAARVLVDFDYLRELPSAHGAAGGRPAEAYEVNPKASEK